MQKFIRMFAFSLAALITAGPAFAATPRVYDAGMGEGDDMSRYEVICPSDKRLEIESYFLTGELCYYRASDSRKQCARGLKLDAAALKACNE